MADADAPGGDEGTFIKFEGMPTVSRGALMLHLQGGLDSIQVGQPGFVSDDYLNAITAETTTTAVELEAAGMWERRDGGYFIVHDQMLKMGIDFNEKTDRLEAECAERGGHLPSDDGDGWVICSHCTMLLGQPDDGPVAPPGRTPLGHDPRRQNHAGNKRKRKRRS
jgi:hypothetical protein